MRNERRYTKDGQSPYADIEFRLTSALKQAIAIYGNDLEWTRLRPPLVELTPEQAELLAAELKAIGFAMPLETKK